MDGRRSHDLLWWTIPFVIVGLLVGLPCLLNGHTRILMPFVCSTNIMIAVWGSITLDILAYIVLTWAVFFKRD